MKCSEFLSLICVSLMPHNILTSENNECMVLKHITELNFELILGKKICLFKETFADLKSLIEVLLFSKW